MGKVQFLFFLQEVFASTDKIFTSEGGLTTRQLFCEVLFVYTSLLLIITLRFTYDKKKIAQPSKSLKILKFCFAFYVFITLSF